MSRNSENTVTEEIFEISVHFTTQDESNENPSSDVDDAYWDSIEPNDVLGGGWLESR